MKVRLFRALGGLSPDEFKPRYCFVDRDWETEDAGGGGGGGGGGWEVADGVRERASDSRGSSFQDNEEAEAEPTIGDGKGVISPIAANCGDEKAGEGDKAPLRTLGTRFGILPEDKL